MNVRILPSSAVSILISVLLAGCATMTPATKPAPSTVAAKLPDSVHWFRDSAEQKAAYLETYRSAEAAVRRLSAGLPPKSWAVILDVDETILDNSDFQKQQALAGLGFQEPAWNAWVAQARAARLPGAKEFIDVVQDALKGQIVLVTNRKQAQCDLTEKNLQQQQIRYDRILCDADGHGDKNARFRAVLEGSTGTPGLHVLVFVGDNIQDFPNLNQSAPGDFSPFGDKYFVLPNPMYGSWVNNPAH